MHSQPSDSEADHYFQNLTASLGRMPAGERARVLLELRQHWAELTAAYEAIGLSHQEAVGSALTQLGDARWLGRKLAREWRLNVWAQTAHVRYAARWLIWLSVFSFFLCDPLLARLGASRFPADWMLVLTPPVLGGVVVGLRWSGHALSAILHGTLRVVFVCLCLLLVILPTWGIVAYLTDPSLAVVAVTGSGCLAQLGHGLLGCAQTYSVYVQYAAVWWLFCWLPPGLFSAYLASAWRRRRLYPLRWQDFRVRGFQS